LTALNRCLKWLKHFVPELFQTFLMAERLTSRNVVELTGITPRQLQWWDERGIVVPRREGHRRLYSMEDLAEVAVICELRHKGFSLQRVRKVMRFLQREFSKRLADTVSGESEYHLLSDGKALYLETSAKQIVDILKNSRQPMLAICLSDTVRRVRAVLRNGKKNGAWIAETSRPLSRQKAS
jgi:DNA-binding transcriptional MerR regulator